MAAGACKKRGKLSKEQTKKPASSGRELADLVKQQMITGER